MGPVNIKAMIDNFERITHMIRPDKTFSELRREEEVYVLDMERVFHHTAAMVGWPRPTTCGWAGKHYGASDWDAVRQSPRPCRRCLDRAPQTEGVA